MGQSVAPLALDSEIFVEGWAQSYGSPYLITDDDFGNDAAELVEEAGTFYPGSDGKVFEKLVFIDGVRRGETSLYQLSDGHFVRGITGAHAITIASDPRQRCRGPIEASPSSSAFAGGCNDPRQRCRGPIEASVFGRAARMCAAPIRDSDVAAPLKRSAVLRVYGCSWTDPRQRFRGPIEAVVLFATGVIHASIRDSDVAAPLKRVQ